MLLAILIFLISLVAFFHFLVSYVRSLLAETSRQTISLETAAIIGGEGHGASQGDFARLVALARLCPLRGKRRWQLSLVGGYYRLLRLLGRWRASSRAWAEQEQRVCAYFAAVELDRRIATTRAFFAERDVFPP